MIALTCLMLRSLPFLLIISRSILRMRNVSDTKCIENQNTNFILSNFFFFLPKICATYEIMWDNILELGRPQMTIWSMHTACWIPKSTNPL